MAKNVFKTIVKEEKEFAKLRKAMLDFDKKPYVKIGLPYDSEETHHERDGISNLDIGFIQEFGSLANQIPERSHIRAAFDSKFEENKKLTDKLIDKVLDGKMSVTQALEKMGLKMVGDVQKVVRAGISPALKHREGTPLLDTGIYIGSFTYVVKKKEEPGE